MPHFTDRSVAYLVHDGRLLVHLHADEERPWEESGLQVPKGGVLPNETPEQAVLREVFEETGLTRAFVVRPLGQDEYDLRPYMDMIMRRHFFELGVNGAVPEQWEHWERGGEHEVREDGGVRLLHYWLPLEKCHVLAGGQGAMLGRLVDH